MGGGGRVEPESRLEGNSSQSWVRNTNITDCKQDIGHLHTVQKL